MALSDPLAPSASVLVKLGSIAVHIEEYFSPHGHPFDRTAIETLLQDGELKGWMSRMNKQAMLPRKRNV